MAALFSKVAQFVREQVGHELCWYSEEISMRRKKLSGGSEWEEKQTEGLRAGRGSWVFMSCVWEDCTRSRGWGRPLQVFVNVNRDTESWKCGAVLGNRPNACLRSHHGITEEVAVDTSYLLNVLKIFIYYVLNFTPFTSFYLI